MADRFKFVLGLLAFLLLAAGVFGFYFLADQAMILRVLSVLAGVALSAAVSLQTEPGRQFFAFGKDAVAEVKKVVWPKPKETWQMTGLVFAFVLVMAIFLYVVDKGLEWVLYDLILRWGSL